MRSSSGRPSVSVPVLSSSTVFAPPSRSSAPAPLTMMPARAARERPATKAIGAARMSGHGVATTMTARPRVRVAGGDPGDAGDDEREGQEVRCVAICEARELGSVGLGCLDEPNDRCVRALRGGGSDPEVEGVAGVRRPGADVPVGGRSVTGSASPSARTRRGRLRRLATCRRQGRSHRPGRRRCRRAEDRRRSTSSTVPSDVSVCDPWCALDEQAELAAGATVRPMPRGRHRPTSSGRRSPRRGTRRAREPRRSRRARSRRHPTSPRSERAGRRDHERDEDDDRAGRPGDVGPASWPTSQRADAGDDRAERDGRQASVAQAAAPGRERRRCPRSRLPALGVGLRAAGA